jgi:hypothetical protein
MITDGATAGAVGRRTNSFMITDGATAGAVGRRTNSFMISEIGLRVQLRFVPGPISLIMRCAPRPGIRRHSGLPRPASIMKFGT